MAEQNNVAGRALQWFHRHRLEQAGIAISSRDPTAYNEVTGYWIPTLISLGQPALATELGRWLVSVQLADGAFRDCFGQRNPFDTGQIVRGFRALAEADNGFREPLRRACNWLLSLIGASGLPKSPFGDDVPDWVLLYAYEPAWEALRFLGEDASAKKARGVVELYSRPPHGPTEWKDLTHFFGYWLEGLADAGLMERVRPHLEKLAGLQARDGSISAYPRTKWVCAPGLAQIGLAWHKCGMHEPARRAMQWLTAHQNSSGGWFGSYGRGADYFPEAEISWAAKFVIDLAQRLQPHKNHHQPGPVKRLDADQWALALSTEESPSAIAQRVRRGKRQPWTDLLLRWTAPGHRVVELGSGTAEMSANLAFHDRQVTLVDLSQANLDFSKALFEKLRLDAAFRLADIEKPLPFSDGEFDVVFSSGVLEHYDDATISCLLREFGRIAKTAVITLVPNASCLPYRIGKAALEIRGKWKWGFERPIRSLAGQTADAGLRLEEETTVGLAHSLNFLKDAGLWQLADQLRANLPDGDCGNGYLLASLAKPVR